MHITKETNDIHCVVAMEILMAPVSLCQKPIILIFNPLK